MAEFLAETLGMPDGDGHRYVFARTRPPTQLSEAEIQEVIAWCTTEFGPRSSTDRGSRWMGTLYFWFRDAQDAMHFKLRWC